MHQLFSIPSLQKWNERERETNKKKIFFFFIFNAFGLQMMTKYNLMIIFSLAVEIQNDSSDGGDEQKKMVSEAAKLQWLLFATRISEKKQ